MQIDHRRRPRQLAFVLLLTTSAAVVLSGIPPVGAAGYRQKVIYDFCSSPGCADGADSRGGLIFDRAGNLYGTSVSGGAGSGTVFELRHNSTSNKWTNTVLYKFCRRSGCVDGARPEAGLIMDPTGGLYGTTASGGAHNEGTVFELRYDANTKKWAETVLYSFCAKNGCADGDVPSDRLVMDGARKLYGTTGAGGAGSAPVGTVFELTYQPIEKKWKETVLHSFCSEKKCSDGASPGSGLIIDKAGNLYGTTVLGGAHSNGTVFELSYDATTKKWAETVLHSFCPSKTPTCSDGFGPAGGLLMAGPGKIYGTTNGGGARNGGTVFELSYDAAANRWSLVTPAVFGGRHSVRGGKPDSELTADDSGNLYGTTTIGGVGKVGTAFRLRFDSSAKKWGLRVLHDFCSLANCIDGGQPGGGLIIDGAGNLYGTTRFGGTHGGGTIFELSRE